MSTVHCRHYTAYIADITLPMCATWNGEQSFTQFQGGHLWKVFCEENLGIWNSGDISSHVHLKIGNGNSDGRTGRLVWKCVSDHFLTTVRVWFYFICKNWGFIWNRGRRVRNTNSEQTRFYNVWKEDQQPGFKDWFHLILISFNGHHYVNSVGHW